MISYPLHRKIYRHNFLSTFIIYCIGITIFPIVQRLSVLSEVKKLFFKNYDLQQLNIYQLKNIAKKNNIKVTLRKRKDEITGAILKTQDSVFREIADSELRFHVDLIEPTKEERKPPYNIIKTNHVSLNNLRQSKQVTP